MIDLGLTCPNKRSGRCKLYSRFEAVYQKSSFVMFTYRSIFRFSEKYHFKHLLTYPKYILKF